MPKSVLLTDWDYTPQKEAALEIEAARALEKIERHNHHQKNAYDGSIFPKVSALLETSTFEDPFFYVARSLPSIGDFRCSLDLLLCAIFPSLLRSCREYYESDTEQLMEGNLIDAERFSDYQRTLMAALQYMQDIWAESYPQPADEVFINWDHLRRQVFNAMRKRGVDLPEFDT